MLALFLSLVLVDQVTKQIAVHTLAGKPPISFLGDTFRLFYAENRGAFLGLGSTLPDGARFWLLTVLNGVFLAIIAGIIFRRRDLGTLPLAALVMLLAGGVGNMIDRVLLDGRVIDFMNMGIGGLRTGIFNVADVAISCGAITLFLSLPSREEPADKQSAGGGA